MTTLLDLDEKLNIVKDVITHSPASTYEYITPLSYVYVRYHIIHIVIVYIFLKIIKGKLSIGNHSNNVTTLASIIFLNLKNN